MCKGVNMKKRYMILTGVICFLAGALMFAYGQEQDEHYLVMFNYPLPQQLIDYLYTVPQVYNVTVVNDRTYLDVVINDAENPPRALVEFVDAVNEYFAQRSLANTQIPGIELPDCKWDYGYNTTIGIYWYNGQQHKEINDPKCQN